MSKCEGSPTICCVSQLLRHVTKTVAGWGIQHGGLPWCRGHANHSWSLQPSLLREPYNEQDLTHNFLKRSGGMFDAPSPDALDEWLYVMRHAGLPTRLLDWSESVLCATYFACQPDADADGALWVLNPYQLNRLAFGRPMFVNFDDEHLEVRCRMAFEWRDDRTHPLPIAIAPSYVHPGIRAQRGCFTIHGLNKDNLESQLGPPEVSWGSVLRKYCVPFDAKSEMLRQLRLCGVAHSTLFPCLSLFLEIQMMVSVEVVFGGYKKSNWKILKNLVLLLKRQEKKG
jgi:hypothetical protein